MCFKRIPSIRYYGITSHFLRRDNLLFCILASYVWPYCSVKTPPHNSTDVSSHTLTLPPPESESTHRHWLPVSVAHRNRLANRAELCNSMQLWAFTHKSLPVLNLRRLQLSECPPWQQCVEAAPQGRFHLFLTLLDKTEEVWKIWLFIHILMDLLFFLFNLHVNIFLQQLLLSLLSHTTRILRGEKAAISFCIKVYFSVLSHHEESHQPIKLYIIYEDDKIKQQTVHRFWMVLSGSVSFHPFVGTWHYKLLVLWIIVKHWIEWMLHECYFPWRRQLYCCWNHLKAFTIPTSGSRDTVSMILVCSDSALLIRPSK